MNILEILGNFYQCTFNILHNKKHIDVVNYDNIESRREGCKEELGGIMIIALSNPGYRSRIIIEWNEKS
ncbi:hypothetical protein BLOT_012367 [Blomia tropicalis]|nr:hypothetical protein BLOT_012367 [Blomia tropicalis]